MYNEVLITNAKIVLGSMTRGRATTTSTAGNNELIDSKLAEKLNRRK
jgi:hypothetical protein